MRWPVLSSIRPSFPGLSQSSGQVTHVILTRSPLIHPQQAGSFSVRLACVKHAASVHPEPGSNSPYKNYETIQSTDQAGNSPIPGTTTTTTRRYDHHGNHSKINGIKQTWHTIEFSNNHTNPTTPPHNVRPSSDSANKHDPRNIMNHTKHGADTTLNQIRKQSQIGMNGT